MQGVAPNRRPVNMVFQQLALFPMMSVGENVAFGLARRGVARAERLRRSKAMLERVGLGGAADKRVDELSGGQRQRVAIARSLVLEPTLLLLDEPLGALDLKLREHMKIELKQLQAAFGTTFVYITHDQSEALVLSDHVGVMSQGRFEQLGTPQDLYYRPQTPFVASFVGANNRIVGRVTGLDPDVGGNDHGRWLGHPGAEERCNGGRRCGRRFRAPGSGESRTRAGGAARRAALRTRARCRACCSTAPIPRCSCRKRARAANFASRCRRPVNSRISSRRRRCFFSFDPERAVCFPARPGTAGQDG